MSDKTVALEIQPVKVVSDAVVAHASGREAMLQELLTELQVYAEQQERMALAWPNATAVNQHAGRARAARDLMTRFELRAKLSAYRSR
jgi:hypothetical protein